MSNVIIDVREPWEFKAAHVKGAINIPMDEILGGSKRVLDLPKGTQLILYCNRGIRARNCKDYLDSKGYTNVINGINKDHVQARFLA